MATSDDFDRFLETLTDRAARANQVTDVLQCLRGLTHEALGEDDFEASTASGIPPLPIEALAGGSTSTHLSVPHEEVTADARERRRAALGLLRSVSRPISRVDVAQQSAISYLSSLHASVAVYRSGLHPGGASALSHSELLSISDEIDVLLDLEWTARRIRIGCAVRPAQSVDLLLTVEDTESHALLVVKAEHESPEGSVEIAHPDLSFDPTAQEWHVRAFLLDE